MKNYLFTSESVTEGHPDKICDQISDAILDSIISQDKNCRVACETTVTTGIINIIGEISTNCYIDIPKIARSVIKNIGYHDSEFGFDYKTCAVVTSIHEQSKDIALGVDNSNERKSGSQLSEDVNGAGDQGMVFGYACDETPELMPLPISLAHKLATKLTEVRKSSLLDYIRPDGKTQVTIEYKNGSPIKVDTIVISTQHSADVDIKTLRKDVIDKVVKPVVPENLLKSDTIILINPTGRFVIGGPQGDSGLTGRKIIVDTYGGYSRHGGGAFSGKDPTKVDRSGAYMARYISKNIVAAKLATKCEIQIAYAIGKANPVSVLVDTFGTSEFSDEELSMIVSRIFDLRPSAIISQLKLKQPLYTPLACYGHMGREDLNVKWEDTDKVNELREGLGLL